MAVLADVGSGNEPRRRIQLMLVLSALKPVDLFLHERAALFLQGHGDIPPNNHRPYDRAPTTLPYELSLLFPTSTRHRRYAGVRLQAMVVHGV
jgi:hypothetical protein